MGRAGRRLDRMSVALTFCKGQKHDEYYFEQPELMLAERTPSPKLDASNGEIIGRVILKWFMNQYASDLYSIEEMSVSAGGKNSGELGSLTTYQSRLADWSALFERTASSVSEKIKILSGQEDAKLLAQILMECGELNSSAGKVAAGLRSTAAIFLFQSSG